MTAKIWDALWINATIATCEKGYGLISKAGIAVKEGTIVWVGEMASLSTKPETFAETIHDVNHLCITPGLIDCHTHLVHAGNRVHEFEQRLQGISYEEIANNGGGIKSTVLATSSTSAEDIFKQSLKRAVALISTGVTTLEVKSGYGLDWPTEMKMLQIAALLEESLPLTVEKTFLAHAFPQDYIDKKDNYVDYICNEMLPLVAKKNLANAVDVFCEKIAFNLDQTEKIFKTAKQLGLGIKCHAEQLSSFGAAALAAKYHALSVDHLEYATENAVNAIAQSGTVAVLLPGAFYFMRETKKPPLAMLRQYNVPIAIASDCNPGTSPVASLLIILNMACVLLGLTPEEALAGVTRNAAKALGLEQHYGTLTVGKKADFAIWDVSHPMELIYNIGGNPLQHLIKHGEPAI